MFSLYFPEQRESNYKNIDKDKYHRNNSVSCGYISIGKEHDKGQTLLKDHQSIKICDKIWVQFGVGRIEKVIKFMDLFQKQEQNSCK
jgi:hypothetical protein